MSPPRSVAILTQAQRVLGPMNSAKKPSEGELAESRDRSYQEKMSNPASRPTPEPTSDKPIIQVTYWEKNAWSDLIGGGCTKITRASGIRSHQPILPNDDD